jgi:predicted alpha/beta-fold hydrolase
LAGRRVTVSEPRGHKKFQGDEGGLRVVLVGIGLLFVLILLYYLATRRVRIEVEFNPPGSVAPIVAQMTSLKCWYYPTPWLPSGIVHTMYGMRKRKRPSACFHCDRHILKLNDGAQVALDFYAPFPNDNSPWVILFPTLGGRVCEPCVANLAAACAAKHWRVIVSSGRGQAGVPFTPSFLTCSTDIAPVGETVAYVRDRFHPRFVFVAGFSMGALQPMTYTGWDGAGVDGFLVVSHSYCQSHGAILAFLGRRVVSALLVGLMRRHLMRNDYIPDSDKDFTGIKTIGEFELQIGYKYCVPRPHPEGEPSPAAI